MIKPYIYSPIPEFDQLTQCVEQLPPVDMGDHYFVGIAIKACNYVFDAELENLLLTEMGVV